MQLFKRFLLVSAVVLGQLTFVGAAQAANDLAANQESASIQLRNFVKGVQKAKGRFTQQTASPDGQAQAKQEGHFAFNREKGQFLWQVERRSEEHTSELQSRGHLVCRLLLEKKKNTY